MSSAAPQPPNGDADWLAGSEGFLVDSPRGRLGVVREIRHDPGSGKPEALVVRAGRLGTHSVVVPVDEIAGVVPSRKTIVLQ